MEKTVTVFNYFHLLRETSETYAIADGLRRIIEPDHDYSSATIFSRSEHNESIVLERWTFSCAKCGFSQPVSGAQIKNYGLSKYKVKRIFREARQTHIKFDERELAISFGRKSVPSGEHSCVRCGHKTELDTVNEHIELHVSGNGAIIELTSSSNSIFFSEVLRFDTNSGRTYYGKEDITKLETIASLNSYLMSFPIYETLKSELQKTLAAPIVKIGLLPSFVDFVVSNRYRNYPAIFYATLPICLKFGERANCCFLASSDVPMNYCDIGKYYSASGLPHQKSIKRNVFKNPSLLFYADEINSLPFSNIDVINTILCSEECFRLLEVLKKHPSVAELIKRMIDASEETATWDAIKKDCEQLPLLLAKIMFVELNDSECMMQLTGSLSTIQERINRFIEYGDCSSPIAYTKRQKALEWRTANYEFILPENAYKFYEAGRHLRNCLTDYTDIYWLQSNNAVVLVLDHDVLLAAIEVDLKDSRVIQARVKYNEDLPRNGDLRLAFDAWVDKNMLTKAWL